MTEIFTIAPDDPTAQQHSEQLAQLVRSSIAANQGWISFADYMQQCLYTPGLGYYSAGSHKLGRGGDFTTAPETSPLFGAAIATHLAEVHKLISDYAILEFGAGTGRLAKSVLERLAERDALPSRYLILEPSADLQQRQQALLNQLPSALSQRLCWVDDIPDNFEGVMLANEVCDAMPVHLLNFTQDRVEEVGVGLDQQNFIWQTRPLSSSRLEKKAEQIKSQLVELPYRTEACLFAADWLETLAQKLSRGLILLIDYGYSFTEYYRADRRQGSLRCYYQHESHDNPLILLGLQDITAHVDFTSLAESAQGCRLEVCGFQEQADFLLAGDITALAAGLQQNLNEADWLQHSTALKQLLLPGAMGHQFKVLSLCRDLDALPRLKLHDRRYQL
jgi:SAM-dependent MidA family methyltransferase